MRLGPALTKRFVVRTNSSLHPRTFLEHSEKFPSHGFTRLVEAGPRFIQHHILLSMNTNHHDHASQTPTIIAVKHLLASRSLAPLTQTSTGNIPYPGFLTWLTHRSPRPPPAPWKTDRTEGPSQWPRSRRQRLSASVPPSAAPLGPFSASVRTVGKLGVPLGVAEDKPGGA